MNKILIVLLCFLSLSFTASAAEILPLLVNKSPEKEQELTKKAESYLNSVKSVEFEFNQLTADGSESAGKFYLKRPGKFRWEYLQGQQALIIGNSNSIVYYDKALNEVTHIPAKDSIANFLARKEIKLSGDIKVLAVDEYEKEFRIVVTQLANQSQGKLALFFNKEPMLLTKMEVIDQDKNLTEIAFSNQKFNGKLADDMFVFKNPKFYKNVWEKK